LVFSSPNVSAFALSQSDTLVAFMPGYFLVSIRSESRAAHSRSTCTKSQKTDGSNWSNL